VKRRVSPLALRMALVPIAAVTPGAALILVAYRAGWPGGVILGCFLTAALPMIASWIAVDAWIVRPLRMITSAIFGLIAGEFSARSPERAHGELATVMRSLDHLAGKLEVLLTAAKTSERRYRRLVEHNPAGMFRTRAHDGRVLDCNPAAVRMLGYASAVEAMSHRAETFYADPRDRATLLERLRTEPVLQNVRVTFRRKDGRPLPVLLSIARIDEGGETYLEGQFIDASVRTFSEPTLVARA